MVWILKLETLPAWGGDIFYRYSSMMSFMSRIASASFATLILCPADLLESSTRKSISYQEGISVCFELMRITEGLTFVH